MIERSRDEDQIQYLLVPLGSCAFFCACLLVHEPAQLALPLAPSPSRSEENSMCDRWLCSLKLAVMPAAARVRDACTHASCESSCRWAKKATGRGTAALQTWIGLSKK